MKRQSLFAVLLAASVFAVGILKSCSAPSPKQFDSREWKSGNASSRGAMVQDLMDRNLLGKSRSEVHGLLGLPDYCGVSSESDAVAVKPCSDLKED